MQKTLAKINLKSILSNAELLKEKSGSKLCAVVKANAYGHGAEEVVNALNGVADCFAVALIEEGISIKDAAAGKDILVFTPPLDSEQVRQILENGLIASVGDLQTARLVARVAKTTGKVCRVHLKVNLGMNRYGANSSCLGKICRFLSAQKRVSVEGLYGHIYRQTLQAATDCKTRFIACKRIYERYFSSGVFHLSATYGVALGREFSFDMVRVGIGLYGYLPTQDCANAFCQPLEKAMRVYARVSCARTYTSGGVGYGDATAKKGQNLSVLRCGYADGFLRKKENGTDGAEQNANVSCMDVCIRLSKSKKGGWQAVMTDADKTARETGTISYEVLCAATRRAEFEYEYE